MADHAAHAGSRPHGHGSLPEGKPKLTYFAGRGVAETTRLILHDAGIEFDDVRVSDITPIKGVLLYGQVPLLEWGNIRLVQSMTIARFVARVTGTISLCRSADSRSTYRR
jgi:glutathione S-transferase